MKRVLSIALVSAVAAGIFGASNMVNADTTDTSTNTDTTANTRGSVMFTPGTLSLSNVTTDAKFAGASVQDVYTKGLTQTADNQMTATVSDFLGAENSAWTITIAKGAWAKTGSDETSSTTALDSSATLTVGSKALTTDGVKVTEGTEGTKTIDPMDLKLDIANNTLLTTGTYTNTLTWTLADPADPNQQ
ncbi:hypothetical protein [Lacticaseibacillus sharpeae]|uniref:hypothetical protein n=1 Tax=Lacticaseibacillus sharpeae TaxID=1626 RepID=UPI000B18C992|nr:hypothetical protein [Lacticaseibacillus sharpeae]